MKKFIFVFTTSTLLAAGLVGCAGDNNNVGTHNDGNVRVLNQGRGNQEILTNNRSYNQREILSRDRGLLNEENNYYHDRLNGGPRPEHLHYQQQKVNKKEENRR